MEGHSEKKVSFLKHYIFALNDNHNEYLFQPRFEAGISFHCCERVAKVRQSCLFKVRKCVCDESRFEHFKSPRHAANGLFAKWELKRVLRITLFAVAEINFQPGADRLI